MLQNMTPVTLITPDPDTEVLNCQDQSYRAFPVGKYFQVLCHKKKINEHDKARTRELHVFFISQHAQEDLGSFI